MLEAIFGSVSCEQVLMYIFAREEGYLREIVRFYDGDYRSIRSQLNKLENNNILRTKEAGKTQIYSFNPRYPFLKELKALLEKALNYYPEEEKDKLLMNRRRPRRTGKPL
jgi:hypothetical protein